MRRLPRSLSAAVVSLASVVAFAPVASAQADEAPQPQEAPVPEPADEAEPEAEPEPAAPPTRPIEREQLLPPTSPTPEPPAQPPVEEAAPPQPGQVFAEDWWTHSRPVIELHGYFRVRAELFHNFSLGRVDVPNAALWPQPADNSYIDQSGTIHHIRLCGDPNRLENCQNKTQAGANMRFRVNPELHISDNLRIMSQIDMLDNLVLGSTPDGTYNQPRAGGYEAVAHGGYVPRGAFATTQNPPTAGINSFKNSIEVKRVWGEYMTPLGQLRFGRMPSHWGLGMLANSGDSYDSDWQSTADRIMFITGIRSLDLYFGGAWDFLNEGATSMQVESLTGGQPYDMAQLDDADQYVLVLMRRRNPELTKLELARGNVVVNGGLYFVYRKQTLANDTAGDVGQASLGAGPAEVQAGYVRRGATAYIPDAWLQILYRKFRFEAEVATIQGTIDNTNTAPGSMEAAKLRQWGVATQTELKAVEDRLRLQFGFGWASGDANLNPNEAGQSLVPPRRGLQPHVAGPNTFSEFRFHPDYRVDLILFRHVLQRVQGAYYFRPSMEYDFTRNPNGQRFGGGAAIIWSRASEFVQTPGHKRDLGVEIDLSLYFQSKDGTLNDNHEKMGGFFTMLQYGVLFPLGGLGYLPGEQDLAPVGVKLDTSAAHTLRWYMGIMY